MALVSIIVPIYGVESYLEQCVNSIRRQTFFDIEIILVDDGSPDRCGQMCDYYAKEDNRIKVIHKANGGLADARNEGIKKATGKYLLFVDSDDRIHEELVKRTVEKAEETNADIVVFDIAVTDEKHTKEELFYIGIPDGRVFKAEIEPRLFLRVNSAVNKLYRKAFWDKSSFWFPKGRYYEDLGTIPKLMVTAERVVYLKEVLYYYIFREDSIMHSRNFMKNYMDRTAVLDQLLMWFEEYGIDDRYREELEYLVFENGYFIPSKEIVLCDRKSIFLDKFREYAYSRFPKLDGNRYIKELSLKDKILWLLLRKKMYRTMVFLSFVRRMKDKIERGIRWR